MPIRVETVQKGDCVQVKVEADSRGSLDAVLSKAKRVYGRLLMEASVSEPETRGNRYYVIYTFGGTAAQENALQFTDRISERPEDRPEPTLSAPVAASREETETHTQESPVKTLLELLTQGVQDKIIGLPSIFLANLRWCCSNIPDVARYAPKVQSKDTPQEQSVDLLEAFLKTPEGRACLESASYEEVDALLKGVRAFLQGLKLTRAGTFLRREMLDALEAIKTQKEAQLAPGQRTSQLLHATRQITTASLPSLLAEWISRSLCQKLKQVKWPGEGEIPPEVKERLDRGCPKGRLCYEAQRLFNPLNRGPNQDRLCSNQEAEELCETRLGQVGLWIAASGVCTEMISTRQKEVMTYLRKHGWEEEALTPPTHDLGIIEAQTSLEIQASSHQLIRLTKRGVGSYQIGFKTSYTCSMRATLRIESQQVKIEDQLLFLANDEKTTEGQQFLQDYQTALITAAEVYVKGL